LAGIAYTSLVHFSSNIKTIQARLRYCKNCKAMLYWQDMKDFVEQIPIKFEGFYVIKINWYKLCCRQVHQNIGKNIG